MPLGYIRVCWLALLIGASALGQSAAPVCDLTHVPRPKPHLTFVDPTDGEVSELLDKGFADPAKGKDFFAQALTLARSRNDVCGQALAEYGEAAAIDRAKTDEIQQHLQKSAELFSSISATHALGQAHYILARTLQRANKGAEGASMATQSAEEFNASGDREHAISSKLSSILMGRSETPTTKLQALLDEAHAIPSPGTESSILQLWGDREFAVGHFSDAHDRYEQARLILEACNCDNETLAALLVSMGRLERMQGQPQVALKYYDRALKLQLADGDDEYSIQTMNAMAVAYDALGQLHESLALYQRALAQANAAGVKQFVPLLEGNIGGEYLKLKRWAEAARQLKMVIAKGSNNYQLSIRYGQLSEALFQLGRLSDAYDAATEGIRLGHNGGDHESLADALEDRARVATAQKHYESALADIHEALAIREEIRSHLVPDDARKQGYNERIQSLYDVSIQSLTAMGKKREALETAEIARARAFLDLMGTQESPTADGLKHLSIDAPSFASYVSAEPFTAAQMSEAAAHYHSTIVAYWITDDALYTWVVNADGTIHDARVPVTRTRLAKLVSETDAAESRSKAPVSELSQARKSEITTRGGAPVTLDSAKPEAWRTLYDLLITPVERYLPQKRGSLLTIIPHHELFRLSFAALTSKNGEYLVEHYALHSVPASALLRYTQENEQRASALPPHYLLVANPTGFTLENGLTLPAIPATLTEVRSIARLLPADAVTSLAGPKAQEAAVTDALQSATVVHFATHAVLDDADPRRSLLLFYPLPDTRDPVRLTTADIYRLKLHTNLVVLSACRTGLGRITGDGIDGFSRAFFYAGTASFLATLWDVADQPTSILLPRFYRELNAGKSRSAALRTAQLEVIQALRDGKVHAHTALGTVTLPENPSFWAAFSLSGEP